MKRQRSRCGQPLLALAVVLGGWVAMRTVAWEHGGPVFAPADRALAFPVAATLTAAAKIASPAVTAASGTNPASAASDAGVRVSAPASIRHSLARDKAAAVPIAPVLVAPGWQAVAAPAAPPSLQAPRVAQTAMGHQLLWMAAVSRLPMPYRLADIAAHAAPPQPFYPAGREPQAAVSRWSADAWLLVRGGGNGRLAAGGTPASYGASQAGAVVRYRLAPGSGYRPAAYLRVSAALNGSREKEAALGLSARPMPRIPVVAAVELRAASQPGATRLRPAAMVVTELPTAALPLATRAEAYGQAGYVGGRDATLFADGQVRIDRAVARFRLGELRAGAGAWAGAQKGASRVDVGPSIAIGTPLGEAGALRLSADWRFRVAGKAAPASGPALTLSAGF